MNDVEPPSSTIMRSVSRPQIMSWTPICTILSRLVKPILIPTWLLAARVAAAEALLLDRVGVGERDRLGELRNLLREMRRVVDALGETL
mgnify:CR=1 FL=1